jgi:predicted DNA-binding ribbon-helix-helix protein
MRPIKRSLTIAGHRTSISLEPEFWEALADVAAAEGVTVAALVARIDEARAGVDTDDPGGLSGAVRLYVLRHFRYQRNSVLR